MSIIINNNRIKNMIKKKKTILIDLDGVLNDYVGNYDIKIFTTRNSELASKWIDENGLNEFVVGVTNVKEPCWVYIDDRCITFDGKFEGLIDKINNFKPYYKK